MKRSKLPKIKNLIKGRVYLLECRNLSYGVWNGKDGFIGIRKKFNTRFLDTEYHWDLNGTVSEAKITKFIVPKNIKLIEILGSIDAHSKRPVDFHLPISSGGKGWYYLDNKEPDIHIKPELVTNNILFKFLDDLASELIDPIQQNFYDLRTQVRKKS